MSSRPVYRPGPDHPITITPSTAHVVVTAGGKVIADTHKALNLQESTYPPVWYIPRSDLDMSLLQRTDHATYCPYKGDCNYYSIPAGVDGSVYAVWSYEAPYDSVAAIKDHLAFYPNRVDSIKVTQREISACGAAVAHCLFTRPLRINIPLFPRSLRLHPIRQRQMS